MTDQRSLQISNTLKTWNSRPKGLGSVDGMSYRCPDGQIRTGRDRVVSQASFVAYIDESGDPGLKFPTHGAGGGSSVWFVVAAVVARKTTELETMKLIDGVRTKIGQKQGHELHFRKLRHDHRVVLVGDIAQAPLRWIAVAMYKPQLVGVDGFAGDKLYFYACRMLLERVSWFCTSMRRTVGEGDGSVDTIFSNRSIMSYDDLRKYIDRVAENEAPQHRKLRINPNVVRSSQVVALGARTRRGLQVADAVASGIFFGLTCRLGYVEPRYAEMLHPRCFSPENLHPFGCGLKIFPDFGKLPDDVTKPLDWLDAYRVPEKK